MLIAPEKVVSNVDNSVLQALQLRTLQVPGRDRLSY